MISLFALIMTLGIVVDDAIVVGEHTATRHAMGDSPVVAAERGAGRMTWPVVAAILTTQAAFLPLLLVRDTIGQIMSALPLVVVAVLTASLIECLLILPGHLRHSLSNIGKEPGAFRRGFDAGFTWFRDGPFRWFVWLTYRWRYTTVALSVGALVIMIGFIAAGIVGFRFFPSPEAENISAKLVFAGGTPERDVAGLCAMSAPRSTGPRRISVARRNWSSPVSR